MTFKKLSLSIAGIFLLAACGSDSDNSYATPSPTPTPAPSPAPTPTPTATDFPVQDVAPETFNANESGTILVSETGLSLYFFANDEAGTSNCSADDGAPTGSYTDPESCAGRWPPLLITEGATVSAPFTSVERADGTLQWAYRDYPLYQFSDDSAQGDVLGDGVGGVWDLARTSPIEAFETSDNALLTSVNQVLSASINAGELALSRLEKQGFNLYTFDNDTLDTANCFGLGNGDCINAWPPILADNAAKPSGLLGIAEQENGVSQWTYRGKPLYLFANDVQPGDTNGQGAGGVWFLATKEPAIQREINGNSWLTATGRVNILTQNAEAELEVQSVDRDQFSLYTFANDEPGVSNCTDGCLGNWPAFLATEFDTPFGDFDIIERADGNLQWTYRQQPLYFFANDTAIDDTNGQGVGNVWWLIPPATTDIISQDSPLGDTLITQGIVRTLEVNANDEFEVVESDKTGLQLYVFDVDLADTSNCDSTGCIGNWPALLAMQGDEAQAPFSLFERSDGYMQWAINGKPLYYFTPDTNAGDQLGEAVGDVWWIARAAPMRLANFSGIGSAFVANRLDINGSSRNDVTREGFTLYTFDNDVAGSGESVCTGGMCDQLATSLCP